MQSSFLICLFKLSSITQSWVIIATTFCLQWYGSGVVLNKEQLFISEQQNEEISGIQEVGHIIIQLFLFSGTFDVSIWCILGIMYISWIFQVQISSGT